MNLWSFTDRFVQEQKILFNVSPATLAWYRYGLKAFRPVLEAEFQSTPAFKVAVVARIADLQHLPTLPQSLHGLGARRADCQRTVQPHLAKGRTENSVNVFGVVRIELCPRIRLKNSRFPPRRR